MTIHLPRADPFHCAICGLEGPPRWDNLNRTTIAPLCFVCENVWSRGNYASGNTDMRLARQISALAEAISASAYYLQNGHRPPYA